MATRRNTDEPAYVLHRYDWSESSLILETFTRGSGRVALVAKGARRPSSNFRPVLLPLQPLRLSFGGDGEIRTLRSAEWVGGHVMPTGDALLSGYYLNELLMRLVARDDPHPGLFDAYAAAVRVLAGESPQWLEPALRAFELVLLREAGLLPALDAQTADLQPLQQAQAYRLVPEAGLVPQGGHEDRPRLSGGDWLRLEAALAEPAPFGAVLQAVPPGLAALKPQLRALLHYHCGVAGFKTRQLMMELQSL